MLIVAILMAPFAADAQVKFIEVVTEDDMQRARQKVDDEGKLLFVDVYATWCGPCKMMDRDVYTDPDVARYMNAHFVNVRMDGETPFGRKYAAANQLEGYPSMFIFAPDGEDVGKIVGFRPAVELLTAVTGMKENYTDFRRFHIEYEQGNMSLSSYPGYIGALRGMGRDDQAEALAAEYVVKRKGEELTDDDILVVAHYMHLEEEWWPHFSADNERLLRVLGEDYEGAMQKIYANTLSRAVEQQDVELVSRMAGELSHLLVPGEDDGLDMRSLPFIQFYYYSGEVEALASYVDRRFDTDRKDDHRWLCGAASRILGMDQRALTPSLLESCYQWLSTCLEYEENYDYHFYMGMVLFFQQKTSEAEQSFQSAERMATGEDEKAMIEQVMRYIRSR